MSIMDIQLNLGKLLFTYSKIYLRILAGFITLELCHELYVTWYVSSWADIFYNQHSDQLSQPTNTP